MKKLLLILTLATLLTFPACGEKTPEFDDMYLLTELMWERSEGTTSGGYRIPAKFNPITGATTPLCTDPLCTHSFKSSCPLAGYFISGKIYDGKFYYIAQLYEGDSPHPTDMAYKSFDLATGKSETVALASELRKELPEDSEDISGSYSFSVGYFWYTFYHNDDVTKPILRIRKDLKSGKTEKIDYLNPFAEYNGKYLFWESEDLTDSYPNNGISVSKSIDGRDKKIIVGEQVGITFSDLLDDGILLYATLKMNEKGGYDWENMTLHGYNLKTDEDWIIIETMPDIYIAACGDYIYYVMPKEESAYLGTDLNHNKKMYNNCTTMSRTNIYTGETEEVYTLPEYKIDPYRVYRIGKHIVVNYRNTDYENYEVIFDGRGDWYVYTTEVGFVTYDTESGEVKTHFRQNET